MEKYCLLAHSDNGLRFRQKKDIDGLKTTFAYTSTLISMDKNVVFATFFQDIDEETGGW
jgi:hypothetical protein